MNDTVFQVTFCPECIGRLEMITIDDADKPIYQCKDCDKLWFIALVKIKTVEVVP